MHKFSVLYRALVKPQVMLCGGRNHHKCAFALGTSTKATAPVVPIRPTHLLYADQHSTTSSTTCSTTYSTACSSISSTTIITFIPLSLHPLISYLLPQPSNKIVASQPLSHLLCFLLPPTKFQLPPIEVCCLSLRLPSQWIQRSGRTRSGVETNTV
jgi:hypothetical protein